MSDVAEAPKRRNWLVRIVKSRDFTRDIIVTTLGVLIALGIGAIVDAIGWRMRLAASERMMDEELSTFRGVAAYNLLTQSCAMDKVDALNDILDKARTSGTLPRIGEIGFTRDFGASGDSWQLAQSSDVMLHMSPKQTMQHASRWVNIRAVSKMGADAQTAWQQLALLQNRPGPISADTVDTVTKDLIVAAYSVGMMNGIGVREDARLDEQGIPRLLANGEPWSLPTIKKWAAEAPICIPLVVDGKPYRSTRPKYQVELPKVLVG